MDSSSSPREATFKAISCGLLFGALFGAANAYLGLKVGLTVSTSIPIAVLSAAAFRLMGGGTILESNLAQTIGSASSSLATGTIFTIPALFMWGIEPSKAQVAVLAMCGGLLGILAMVPLRRLLIVQGDAELPYPEGRACAEVLKSAERGTAAGRWIFIGLAAGALVKLAITGRPLFASSSEAMHPFVPEELKLELPFLPNGALTLSVDAVLLAVGFIVGYRAAAVMVAGGLLSALLLYPLVTKMHGAGIVDMNGDLAAKQLTMSAAKGFVRYLGVGAVAAAGLVTVFRTAPTMLRSFTAVVRGLKSSGRSGEGGAGAATERTDRDLPAWVLVVGLTGVALVLALTPGLLGRDLGPGLRVVAAIAVVVFGFLFVPVSSRLVGVIGVSSNPTSAMALITLAGTAGFFVLLGRVGDLGTKAAVLTVGTVVCVAASKAGDISQDLKTGWIVGATPARQQLGQLLAAAVACWVVAAVVLTIGKDPNSGFTGSNAMPAPQANLMKTVVEAVLGGKLPWDLVAMGGGISLVAALVGLAPLQVALGIYLPLSTMTTIFVGGCLRRIVEARARGDAAPIESGILCASGLVAGVGLAGVLLAAYAYFTGAGAIKAPAATVGEEIAGLVLVALASALLLRSGRRSKN
jgi:putative OPT family oligopeptide transporter